MNRSKFDKPVTGVFIQKVIDFDKKEVVKKIFLGYYLDFTKTFNIDLFVRCVLLNKLPIVEVFLALGKS